MICAGGCRQGVRASVLVIWCVPPASIGNGAIDHKRDCPLKLPVRLPHIKSVPACCQQSIREPHEPHVRLRFSVCFATSRGGSHDVFISHVSHLYVGVALTLTRVCNAMRINQQL